MILPRVRERVRVEGHDETFRVVQVDPLEGWVDVACIESPGYLLHVPVSKVQPVDAAAG